MGYDAGLKVGIDGEAEFKQSIKSLNGEIRNVGQELRAVTKEFESNANSVEALTAKNRVLEKEIDLHKAKVEALSKEYKSQTDELKKLEQKLEETKKPTAKTQKRLRKLKRNMIPRLPKSGSWIQILERRPQHSTDTPKRWTQTRHQ